MSLRDVLTRAEEAEREYATYRARASNPHNGPMTFSGLWATNKERRQSESEFHAAFPPSLVRELVDALEALDGPLSWLVEHYPKAMREIPSEQFQAFRRARELLSRLDSGERE